VSVIQEIHNIEVSGGLAWPEEGKILVYLGCPLDPPPRERMFGEFYTENFTDAANWIREKAKEVFGAELAAPSQMAHEQPIVLRSGRSRFNLLDIPQRVRD